MTFSRPILAVSRLRSSLSLPDRRARPALKTATLANLQDRVRFTCVRTQANLQNVSASQVNGGCSCYARRTIRALDKEELASTARAACSTKRRGKRH